MENRFDLEGSKNTVLSNTKFWSAFATGLAVGGVAVCFLDPIQGRQRRARVREKATRVAHRTRYFGGKLFRDLRNRSKGVVAEASRLAHARPSVDDDTLVKRVRSDFGHVISHPRSIQVSAHDGEVTLSGPVLADEVSTLIRCVEKVDGVKWVNNELDVQESPLNNPSLQGEGKAFLH